MATTTVSFSKRSQHKLEFTLSAPTISGTLYTYTYSARMVTSGNGNRPYASGLTWIIDVLTPSAQQKGTGTYSYDFRSPTSLNATFTITGSQTFTINRPASTGSDANYTVRFRANTNNTTELIGTATATEAVTILKQVPATPKPTWDTSSFNGASYVGTSFGPFSLTATGATSYTLASGSLPPGISLSSSGSLSGTPSAGTTQTFSFTVNATNTGGSTASNTFYITRYQPLATWTDTTLSSDIRVGVPYSDSIQASNASSYSVVGLPSGGLSFSNGVVSGTPTSTSSISFNVTASNADGFSSGTQYFTLTPKPRLAVWLDNTLGTTTIKVGQEYADGVVADYATTYAVHNGTLPPGLTLDTTSGVLDGIPTTVGTYSFVLRAANNIDERIFTSSLSITVEAGGSAKVWNGSSWVIAPFKVWNGSSWVEAPAKVWNGSSWADPTV